MNREECLFLISVLSAAGLMHVQQDQADVWAIALEGIRLSDATQAARQLITYRTGDQRWVTPADIRNTVRKLRAETIASKDKDRLPPAELADDLARERAWIQAWNRHVGDGLDVEEANRRADIALLGAPRRMIEAKERDMAQLSQYAKPRKPKPKELPPKPHIPTREEFLAQLTAYGIPAEV